MFPRSFSLEINGKEKMKKLSASILSADFGKLAEEVQAVEAAGYAVPDVEPGPSLVTIGGLAPKPAPAAPQAAPRRSPGHSQMKRAAAAK